MRVASWTRALAPAHSASSILRMSWAERSQKSWPRAFSCQGMRCFSTRAMKSCGVKRASADLAKWGLAERKFSGAALMLVKLQRPPPEMRIFLPGRSACSRTRVRRPRRPASIAHMRPAAPAPRMRTSTSVICLLSAKKSLILQRHCALMILISSASAKGRTMKIDTKDFYVRPGEKLKLKNWPTKVKPVFSSKEEYKELLEKHVKELSSLQQLLYGANRYALLIVFQGLDAAGKDGAIRHVMSGVNPQGCEVSSFKQPSADELEHDFLWRSTQRLPERGRIGI